jgi:hypothetical protein
MREYDDINLRRQARIRRQQKSQSTPKPPDSRSGTPHASGDRALRLAGLIPAKAKPDPQPKQIRTPKHSHLLNTNPNPSHKPTAPNLPNQNPSLTRTGRLSFFQPSSPLGPVSPPSLLWGNPRFTAQPPPPLFGSPFLVTGETPSPFAQTSPFTQPTGLFGSPNRFLAQANPQSSLFASLGQQPKVQDRRTPEQKLRDRSNCEDANLALAILRSNHERLNNEQKLYTQNQNPNSPHWQRLWQAADSRRQIQQQQSKLWAQRNALSEALNGSDAPPGLYAPVPGESPEARRKRIESHPYYRRQVQLQSQIKAKENEIAALDYNRATLEFQYPGLRAVQGETGKNPQDLKAVLDRIPKEFNGMRHEIEQLTQQVERDPAAVRKLNLSNINPVIARQLKEFGQSPEDRYRARFEREAANTAQNILRANRDRLDLQQKQYSQDQNPNSPHWQQLWQVANQRRMLQQSRTTLREKMNALREERIHAEAPPDLYELRIEESPEARRKRIQSHPYYRRQVQIQDEIKAKENQVATLEQARVTLEFQYPGVRAVQGETGKDPKDVKTVLSRMPEEFNGIRSNIDQLSQELQWNPSAVRNLDSVVATQLERWRKDKSIPPEQTQQVEQWLRTEKENKQRIEQATGAVGGILGFVSLFLPQTWPAKIGSLMRWGGAGLSLYSAASSLPDLMMVNQATQAQRGGAGQLTEQSEGEAQFNLVMGYSNLVLAGVDAGLEVGIVQRLAKSTMSLAGSRVSLTQRQWSQLIEYAKQGPSGAEQARALLASVKNLPQQVADELWSAIDRAVPQPQMAGVPRNVANDVANPNQPMQSTGTGRGSGRSTAPNPNVTTEIAAKWSQAKNWKDVEPLIGQQAGGALPKGYHYRTRNGRTEIVRKTQNNEALVPLQVGEDGTFQITTKVSNRISNAAAMRKNFEAKFGKLQSGYWIHHVIPDDVVRNNALAKFARRLGYNLDDSRNLVGLAGKEEWAKVRTGQAKAPTNGGYGDSVGHWSSHAQYSGEVNEYLSQRLGRLERKYGDLENALKDSNKKKQLTQEVDKVMRDAEDYFRNKIQSGDVPKTGDGRLAWIEQQETEPTA